MSAVATAVSRAYSLYGLVVRSELALPLAAPCSVDDQAAAWEFRLAETRIRASAVPEGSLAVATVRCSHGAEVVTRYDSSDGSWLRYPSTATFHIVPSMSRVDIYREEAGNDELISLLLVTDVAVVILHLSGRPTLHASAVLTARGAIAFVGAPGEGKSTLAATFLQRGSRLLSDDALPLQVVDGEVRCGPSLPGVKMWADTAMHTVPHHDGLARVLPHLDKRVYLLSDGVDLVAAPIRLAAVYRIERGRGMLGDEVGVEIEPLSRRQSLTTLLGVTAQGALLRQHEVAALVPTYAHLVIRVPVRTLRYPSGFEHRDRIHARILVDLENVA